MTDYAPIVVGIVLIGFGLGIALSITTLSVSGPASNINLHAIGFLAAIFFSTGMYFLLKPILSRRNRVDERKLRV